MPPRTFWRPVSSPFSQQIKGAGVSSDTLALVHDETLASPLTMWAVQMHEIFQSLTKAGFEEDQALYIVLGLMHSMRVEED